MEVKGISKWVIAMLDRESRLHTLFNRRVFNQQNSLLFDLPFYILHQPLILLLLFLHPLLSKSSSHRPLNLLHCCHLSLLQPLDDLLVMCLCGLVEQPHTLDEPLCLRNAVSVELVVLRQTPIVFLP